MKRMAKVCLNCGSAELGVPPVGLGTVPGRNENAGVYHCRKCGWVGFPVEVENAVAFRKHLKKIIKGKKKNAVKKENLKKRTTPT